MRANTPIYAWCSTLVLAVALVYANSLGGAFVFDDTGAILRNDSIRQIWPLHVPLQPPAEAGTGGRPLANLSFALNYAISGLAPGSYHGLNVAIHLANALLVFALVRRTLAGPRLQPVIGTGTTTFAGAAALLWAVQPVQTIAVTYVSQRTESLMAFFYLLTLYAFARGAGSRRGGWHVLAVIACLAGTATKEVMMTAPLAVLVYDRTFVSGTFGAAWRRHRGLYIGLGCSWILLGALLATLPARSVGYGQGVTWYHSALTQLGALVTYLKLIVWPSPLVFDRGAAFARSIAQVLLPATMVAGVLVLTVYLFVRHRSLGFAAGLFLLILAPTTSFVPIVRQPIAENRVYLPSAVALCGVVAAVVRLAGKRGLIVLLVAAVPLGALTLRRNADFRSPVRLWSDTIAKRPGNPRAYDWLGMALLERGDTAGALQSLQKAVALGPTDPTLRHNYATVCAVAGNVDEAIRQYEEALRLKPDFASAESDLGYMLFRVGRVTEAQEHLRRALQHRPDFPEAQNHLGLTLPDANAVACFEAALRARANFPEAHNNLGIALFRLGRREEAIAHFETAIQLKPGYPEAIANLANARRAMLRPAAER